MQQHQGYKCTILVPHLWFIKQQVGKEAKKAGGKVIKAKLLFWNSPFWPLSCCCVWNVLYGLPVPAGILHRECVGSGSQLGAGIHRDFPALGALGLCCCCPPAAKCGCLSSQLSDFSVTFCFWHHPQCFFLWKKELLLYRKMDLTVWRKQVTSHHYIR